MSGFQIRLLDFVTVEEDTVCDNCGDVCERKAEMVKQECKCGCVYYLLYGLSYENSGRMYSSL